MPRIPDSRPEDQVTVQDAVIGILTAVCSSMGHRFSWYTSKAGRIWISFQAARPTLYSSNVELPASFSAQETLDALEVLLAEHLPKVYQETPPLPTWFPLKSASEAKPRARAYCAALYAHYLAGESILPADYPDAPIHYEVPDADADGNP